MQTLSRLIFAGSVLALAASAAAQGPAWSAPQVHTVLSADSLYDRSIDSAAVWKYRIVRVSEDTEPWVEVKDPTGRLILIPRFYQQVIAERAWDAQEGRLQRVNINLPRPAFYTLLGLLAGTVLVLVLFPVYVYRRRYLAELEKGRLLQETKRQLAESREDERRTLARELHDGPLQDLHALHMQLGVAAESLAAGAALNDESVRKRVRGAQDDTHTVVDDLRRITEALRPTALGPFGLAAALASHRERFCHRHPGIDVQLSLDADGLDLPESTRLALFRIAQEAMNNAVKHGPPSRIDVALDLSDDEVCLTIEDDGPGLADKPDLMALATDGHFGLLGMQERTDSVSGTLEVSNRPGGGLRVHAAAPR